MFINPFSVFFYETTSVNEKLVFHQSYTMIKKKITFIFHVTLSQRLSPESGL